MFAGPFHKLEVGSDLGCKCANYSRKEIHEGDYQKDKYEN